jgi:hypothetical protein
VDRQHRPDDLDRQHLPDEDHRHPDDLGHQHRPDDLVRQRLDDPVPDDPFPGLERMGCYPDVRSDVEYPCPEPKQKDCFQGEGFQRNLQAPVLPEPQGLPQPGLPLLGLQELQEPNPELLEPQGLPRPVLPEQRVP